MTSNCIGMLFRSSSVRQVNLNSKSWRCLLKHIYVSRMETRILSEDSVTTFWMIAPHFTKKPLKRYGWLKTRLWWCLKISYNSRAVKQCQKYSYCIWTVFGRSKKAIKKWWTTVEGKTKWTAQQQSRKTSTFGGWNWWRGEKKKGSSGADRSWKRDNWGKFIVNKNFKGQYAVVECNWKLKGSRKRNHKNKNCPLKIKIVNLQRNLQICKARNRNKATKLIFNLIARLIV